MSIRTKQDCHETSLTSTTWGMVCETVPIIDWKLYLQRIPLAVNNNPNQISQNIQVPELQHIYPNYTSFKFVMTFTNSSPVNWFSVSSSKLNGNVLNLAPGENVDLNYDFRNLDMLDLGITQLVMKCQAFGVKSGVETELQNEMIEGIIEMQKSDNSGAGFKTNRDVFNLTYNLANNILSGDKEIVIYSKSSVGYENVPFGLNVSQVEGTASTSLHLSLASSNLSIGNHNAEFVLKAEGKRKSVRVNLEVVNNGNQFYVEPDLFDFTLLKSENLSANGTVNLINPNGLSIVIDSFPSFLNSCSIVNGKVVFASKSAAQLNMGLSSGNIVLKAGSITKTIFLRVNVIEHIVSDFIGASYYFALDRNKVQLTKVHPEAVKILMDVEMFFLGYGEMHNERQTYQLPYFQDKAIFYPGDEINDFFIKQRSLQDFSVSFNPYQLSNVKLIFHEVDSVDNVLNTFIIDGLRFAPGYKPKCFPFFTDYGVRSYYHNSKCAISFDQSNRSTSIRNFLSMVPESHSGGLVVKTQIFNANVLGNNQVYDFNEIKLIPLPRPSNVCNIFWETHNLVFDWFSCAADFEIVKDFEHTISENVKNGVDQKYETKETETLNLNTGWLLNEEIEVVDAIFNSNFVIIQLPDVTLKAIPTAKKNNLKSSIDGFRSMMLEFRIIRDER